MSVCGLQGSAPLAAPTGCFSASFCQAAPSYLPWVLEALTVAPDVLLDSAPLGFCVRTHPWSGTVTSAPVVQVGKLGGGTLAAFPREAADREAHLALLPPVWEVWRLAEY